MESRLDNGFNSQEIIILYDKYLQELIKNINALTKKQIKHELKEIVNIASKEITI